MTRPNVSGPIIVWENHGYNSWMPKSYPDMRSAVCAERLTPEWVITEVTSSRGALKKLRRKPKQ